MKQKMKRILGVLLIGFILLLIPFSANADDFIPPEPFYVLSEDGTKVFHVTPELREDLITWNENDFPATGLYYNTDPLIPIYLVAEPFEGSAFGFLWEQDFIFSRDMHYFVWIPSTNHVNAFDITQNKALVFYANGVVQKTYVISDLVHNADAVDWTTTTVVWMYNRTQTIAFDAETNLLTIKTVGEQTYVFDITTGEIVDIVESPITSGGIVETIEPPITSGEPYVEIIRATNPPFSWFQFAALAAGIVVLIGGIAFLYAKRRRA